MTNQELRDLRHRINFDMRSMAACLGVPLSTYQRYEDGSAAVPERIERATLELEKINTEFMAGLPARVDSRIPKGGIISGPVEPFV